MVTMTGWDGVEFDGTGVLRDLTAAPVFPPPPDWTWTLAEHWSLTDSIDGVTVAISTGAGVEYNLRAVGKIWSDPEGLFVTVLPDRRWREWQAIPVGFRPARPQRCRAVRASSVWVFHQAPAAPTS